MKTKVKKFAREFLQAFGIYGLVRPWIQVLRQGVHKHNELHIKRIDMSKLEHYAANQRSQYDATSQNLDDAKNQVAPNYDNVRNISVKTAHMVLSQYYLRRGQFYQPGETNVDGLKLLDFGCGIGRVMEAFREIAPMKIDGCDISDEMLKHARQSDDLKDSDFFLTNGTDTGDVPRDFYDIAYSFLCFHHIPLRQTRLKLLEAMAANLSVDGMVYIEFKSYPGITAGKIPPNHAHWTENMLARYTNSASDVWITPDTVGLVMDDFRLFFDDIAVFEFGLGQDLYNYDPDAIYQYGFNEMFIIASKRASMKGYLSQLD